MKSRYTPTTTYDGGNCSREVALRRATGTSEMDGVNSSSPNPPGGATSAIYAERQGAHWSCTEEIFRRH